MRKYLLKTAGAIKIIITIAQITIEYFEHPTVTEGNIAQMTLQCRTESFHQSLLKQLVFYFRSSDT
jgi:hypothetical protein